MSKLLSPLPITLDRERSLFCTFDSLMQFQKWIKEDHSALHMVRSSVASLLLHEDSTMTPNKVSKLIPLERFKEIRDAALKVLKDAQEVMGLFEEKPCGECGVQVPAESKFCGQCGVAVPPAEEKPAPSLASPQE